MQSKLQTLSGFRFTPIEMPLAPPAEHRIDEPVLLEPPRVLGMQSQGHFAIISARLFGEGSQARGLDAGEIGKRHADRDRSGRRH